MDIENNQAWKICKNNLSEENPCGLCLLGASGKTVFHKYANGIDHVHHKACMKARYETPAKRKICPTCKEKISYGDLKGRYEDLAEKFEKWNYPQADQVENLDKKGSIVIAVVAGVSLLVAVRALFETEEILKRGSATGAMEMERATTLITTAAAATIGAATLGFKYSLIRRKGMTTAMAAAAEGGALTAAAIAAVAARVGEEAVVAAAGTVGALAVFTTGLLRGEVENLAGAVAAAVSIGIGVAAGRIGIKAVEGVAAGLTGVVAGVAGAELTGRVTESFTRRIVRWMKE